ncbi:MAG: hypothetical protein IJ515_04885 [Clostridia bacterium]|nr:hypothetical protein [Clostridia bacterium]
MIKSKNFLWFATAFFFIVELVLGVHLHLASGTDSQWICYTVVLAACIFCAMFAELSLSYLFTQLALVFTVCADTFLILLPSELYLYGMIFFTCAQLSYAARIHFEIESIVLRRVHLIARGAVTAIAVALTFLVLRGGADALSVISVVYFAHLITNAVYACFSFIRNPVFAIGLLLFIGCDIFVGFSNLGGYLPIAEGTIWYFLAHPGINAAWIFYTPSQALLSISLFPKRLREI